MSSFEDKVAVVTGASKGIGLAVVRGLVADGARVVAGARSFPRELEPEGGAALTVVSVDLATPDGPRLLVDAAIEAYGGVDILVNNLGGLVGRTPRFPRLPVGQR